MCLNISPLPPNRWIKSLAGNRLEAIHKKKVTIIFLQMKDTYVSSETHNIHTCTHLALNSYLHSPRVYETFLCCAVISLTWLFFLSFLFPFILLAHEVKTEAEPWDWIVPYSCFLYEEIWSHQRVNWILQLVITEISHGDTTQYNPGSLSHFPSIQTPNFQKVTKVSKQELRLYKKGFFFLQQLSTCWLKLASMECRWRFNTMIDSYVCVWVSSCYIEWLRCRCRLEVISTAYVNYRYEDSKQLLHNDLPWACAWLSSSVLMGLLPVLSGFPTTIYGTT